MAKNLKQLSVITKVSTSRSLSSSINYTTKKKPKDSDHGQIKKRPLMIRGINCPDDPKLAEKQMRSTLKKAGINKKNIQDIREIKSFNHVLDYHNKDDQKLAMKLDIKMMKKEHPNNQVLAVLQADGSGSGIGKGHCLHIHNHVCPRQFTDLKSITNNQTDWEHYLRPKTDQVMAKNGFKNEPKKLHSRQAHSFGVVYHSAIKGDSWVTGIQNVLNKARSRATNPDNYAHLVKECGINIEQFKMHKINGQRELHYYKTAGKHPDQSKKVTTGSHKGQYLRYRKHWSYSVYFQGRNHKIRDKRLGHDFFVPNLVKQFKINRTKPSQSISPTSHQANPHQQKQIHHQNVPHPTKSFQTQKVDPNSVNHAPKIKDGLNSKNKHNPITFKNVSIKGYTQRNYKDNLGQTRSLSVPIPHLTKTFHMPFIQLPHMPSMPLMRLVGNDNSEAKQIANQQFNDEQMDHYKQQYDDYSSAKATKQDVLNMTRAKNNEIRRINNQRRFTR